MAWTGKPVVALAVGVVLLAGTAGCGSRGEQGKNGEPSPPVGRLLEEKGDVGRPCREVGEEGAPEVGVEVTPDADGGWDIRLTVRNFRFPPDGTAPRAVPGRGLAHLYVNDRLVALLRTPGRHLPAHVVRRGTRQVTARLPADDESVWTVRGKPVESTAGITVVGPAPTGTPTTTAPVRPTADPAVSSSAAEGRDPAGGRGSPDGTRGASRGPCPMRHRSAAHPCSGAAPNGSPESWTPAPHSSTRSATRP